MSLLNLRYKEAQPPSPHKTVLPMLEQGAAATKDRLKKTQTKQQKEETEKREILV